MRWETYSKYDNKNNYYKAEKLKTQGGQNESFRFKTERMVYINVLNPI